MFPQYHIRATSTGISGCFVGVISNAVSDIKQFIWTYDNIDRMLRCTRQNDKINCFGIPQIITFAAVAVRVRQ